MKTTRHFREDVKPKRPYLKDGWCRYVVQNPEETEIQDNGRIRHWAFIEELGKYLRVVTLQDGETIHTAYPDRNYTRRHDRQKK